MRILYKGFGQYLDINIDVRIPTGTPITIALDGIAVIVNPQNPTDDMSTEDIKDIFTGTKTMWSEIA